MHENRSGSEKYDERLTVTDRIELDKFRLALIDSSFVQASKIRYQLGI